MTSASNTQNSNEANEQGSADVMPESPEQEVGQTVEAAENNEANPEILSAEGVRISELELALATAQSTVVEQKDSVFRAKAEVDNVRRRSAQDVEKARKFALEKFSSELLITVDNLERALESIDKADDANKAIVEGIELTLQGLITSLEKFGVKAVNPQDQPFNPELHQAMSMQEVPGVAPNTVIAVMQKGYELNGRLIRPAMVMVSKAAPVVDETALT
jgi:molecular chaperone GrpE